MKKFFMPPVWIQMLINILTDHNFNWPKQNFLNHYMKLHVPNSIKVKSVWCPVITNIILSALLLPVRVRNLLFLDSGEGDKIQYDPKSNRWKENKGRNAGYWSRLHRFNPNRGVVRKSSDCQTDDFFSYIDINGNSYFNRNLLFAIPSTIQYFKNIVAQTREWQEINNPIQRPLTIPNPVKCAQNSDYEIFPLFRLPPNLNGNSTNTFPSNYMLNSSWLRLLDEFEKIIKRENSVYDGSIITKRDKNGLPIATMFPFHTVRISVLFSNLVEFLNADKFSILMDLQLHQDTLKSYYDPIQKESFFDKINLSRFKAKKLLTSQGIPHRVIFKSINDPLTKYYIEKKTTTFRKTIVRILSRNGLTHGRTGFYE